MCDPAWEEILAGASCRGETFIATSEPVAALMADGEAPQDQHPWQRWGEDSLRRFEEALGGLVSRAGSVGAEIAVRTALGGMISDVPSLVRFSGARVAGSGRGAGLVVEPAAMIDQSMRGNAAEHLERLYGVALAIGGIRAVVVSNLRAGDSGDVETCGVEEGELDPGWLAGVVRAAWVGTGGVSSARVVIRGDAGLIESHASG